MGLLSFLRRNSGADAAPRVRRAIPPRDPATLEALRLRARRRLLGAAVLVVSAVVLIPWALDSAPRPPEQWAGEVKVSPAARVAADRAVVSAVREGDLGAGTASGAAAVAAKSVSNAVSAAPKVEPPKAAASKPREPERVATKDTKKKPESKKSEPKKPESKKLETQAPESKPTEAKAVGESPRPEAESSKSSRYVVQAGAYGDMEAAQAVRERIGKLGLHSVYNTAETPKGKRVRVRLGPFNRKEDADRAAAKLRAGGLGATVLTWESSR